MILIVITARPSYARVQTVLSALESGSYGVITAGSAVLDRYGCVSEEIAQSHPVVESIPSVIEGNRLETSAQETGLLTMQLARVFARLKPEIVVTIADRHETLATAIAASYQHIPLMHLQGGETTGSIDDKVRHAVSQLADWHCVATSQAGQRLITRRESVDVYVTGCPSTDLAQQAFSAPPVTSLPGVGSEIYLQHRFGIVLHHSVTSEVDQSFDQTTLVIRAAAAEGLPLVVFWPGQDAGADWGAKALRLFRDQHQHVALRFVRHVPAPIFLRLLTQAAVLIGNSSAGIREGSYLGLPVVNIGNRQKGRERAGNVIDVEYDERSIRAAMQTQIHHLSYPASQLYGDGECGPRIAGILTALASR